MTAKERAAQLRRDPQVHYNCAQAVLIPFAEAHGLSFEQARDLGAHFGGGMRVGATCGAVTGALMALGLLGKGQEEARAFWNEFQAAAGCTGCAELKRRQEEGCMSCDSLIQTAVELVERRL